MTRRVLSLEILFSLFVPLGCSWTVKVQSHQVVRIPLLFQISTSQVLSIFNVWSFGLFFPRRLSGEFQNRLMTRHVHTLIDVGLFLGGLFFFYPVRISSVFWSVSPFRRTIYSHDPSHESSYYGVITPV